MMISQCYYVSQIKCAWKILKKDNSGKKSKLCYVETKLCVIDLIRIMQYYYLELYSDMPIFSVILLTQ